MRVFFDTEFADRGTHFELISIGLITEDGRTYYAESALCNVADVNDWVKANVVPHLSGPRLLPTFIAEGIKELIGDAQPEFWAYYATYDADLLFRIFGGFLGFPWPQIVHDLMTLRMLTGVDTKPVQIGAEHNALADAQWNLAYYKHLTEKP